MAVVVTGTPASASAATITLPVHAIGDLLVIFAWNGANATVITVPTAGGTVPTWVAIPNAVGAGTSEYGGVWTAVATATNHTSGTWTSSTQMGAIVVRGWGGTPNAPTFQTGTAVNSATAPAVTQLNTSGNALLLQFYAHRTATAWAAAPANYTRQTSATDGVRGICMNSKTSSTTDGLIAQTCTAASGVYWGEQVEFLPEIIPDVVMPQMSAA